MVAVPRGTQKSAELVSRESWKKTELGKVRLQTAAARVPDAPVKRREFDLQKAQETKSLMVRKYRQISQRWPLLLLSSRRPVLQPLS